MRTRCAPVAFTSTFSSRSWRTTSSATAGTSTLTMFVSGTAAVAPVAWALSVTRWAKRLACSWSSESRLRW